MHFSRGEDFFSGRILADVVRERYSVPGTDYGRQKLYSAGLIGIAKAVLNPSNVSNLQALIQTVPEFLIATNMTQSDMLSVGLGVRSDFHPSERIHYYQVKGTSESIYDDILRANNDEVILNQQKLHQVIKDHFEQ